MVFVRRADSYNGILNIISEGFLSSWRSKAQEPLVRRPEESIYDSEIRFFTDIGDKFGPSLPTVKLVTLVFGRPTLPLVRDQIIPDIDYWNHVSGEKIDFFTVGFYTEDIKFDPTAFDDVLDNFEERSTWKYAHETDLLLLNARFTPTTLRAEFDFSNVVALTLERALEEKAVVSIPQFFGNIVDFASSFQGDDPSWGFSDAQGKRLVGSALKNVLISLLPEAVRADAKSAFSFYVKDYRPKE